MSPLPGAANWELLAATKRKSILDAIPARWRLPEPVISPEAQKDVSGYFVNQYLTSTEIEITACDATDLVKQIADRTRTSEEVVTAFCHRAALAHQLTHCLHEIFFDEAIQEARRLDEWLRAGGKPIGPLHGLPVSFKDQFHVRGVETTMGYLGWMGTFEGTRGTGREKTVESQLVSEVRALGGIPFCKSSLPHTVMSMETWNNIVGYTLNPHNRLMGAGGSSGGEGALIGMRGSPVGFGTDIGGSIRVPSAFCGLYGIRPSYGRISYNNVANSMAGQTTVPSVCGPMASSARDLRLMLQSVLSQQPWLRDPAVIELPWRDEPAIRGRKLVFGVYRTNGEVNPLPPVRRALDEIVGLIHKLGHETITWNPPSHQRGIAIARKAWAQDGGIDMHRAIALSGEPLMDRVAEFFGDAPKPPMTGDAIHQSNIEKAAYQAEYMEYWNSTATLTTTGRPVDAVLCPVTPFAALQVGKTESVAYGPWVNTLDYTSVVLPVSKVNADIDKVASGYIPVSDIDKSIHAEYDPVLQQGTPVAVQLVGRRLQEEKMISLLEMFEDGLREEKQVCNSQAEQFV